MGKLGKVKDKEEEQASTFTARDQGEQESHRWKIGANNHNTVKQSGMHGTNRADGIKVNSNSRRRQHRTDGVRYNSNSRRQQRHRAKEEQHSLG